MLGFLIAEALVRRFPEYHEGDLSRLKAHLVSAAHLHGVARRLELGSFLELGRSEEMSGGRTKKTLLVDGLEAIMAAIYLDGGVDAARAFVAAHVLDAPFFGDEEAGTDIQPAITNFKSALQELAQSRKLPQPRYCDGAGARAGAFQDVHGGSPGGEGLDRHRPKDAPRRLPRSAPRAACMSGCMGDPIVPLAGQNAAESGASPAT